ncbi:hypothetical protein FGB62_19g042 [Gracilaria domingensis]|nr:hypothetical protein FGB62_19g042 [Gracilaria domingensis]
MTDYSAVMERDGLAYGENNQGHSISGRGIIIYADENKELNYGSVTNEIRSFNKHGEDCRMPVEVIETDAETVKSAALKHNENPQLDVGRTHKLSTSQMLATHFILFVVGCILIKIWPHPRLDVTKHESFVLERKDCLKSFQACTMDESNSNKTCMGQFLTCGWRLANRNDRCGANYINCTLWATSLKNGREAGFNRCETEHRRCLEYEKLTGKSWKSVAFIVMVLSLTAYLSQSLPVMLLIGTIEIAIGIYTDSFRGYALGTFLAALFLPCFSGVGDTGITQQQAQQNMAHFQDL